MRTFRISNQSKLSKEEKLRLLDMYDAEDLFRILQDYDEFPENYDKEIIIAVQNRLFEYGITSI